MATANIIDLRAYREHRDARRSARQLEASTQAGSVDGFASALPFPVLIGWFPYWIVVGVPLATGNHDV